MSAACRSFRELLELKLTGRPAQSELTVLSWHEHLLGCGACRELLEAEEALELLLASLPEPHLPPELARRVIFRLRDADRRDRVETGLDALLDLDRFESPPAHLAESVLARLRVAREMGGAPAGDSRAEDELDRLLDLDRELVVPDGVASRVLAGLRAARRAEARRASRIATRTLGIWLAAAALVVATWLAWSSWSRAPEPIAERGDELAQQDRTQRTGAAADASNADVPEEEMLAVLDVLEQWDLLMHADIDVLLSTLNPVDLEPPVDFESAEPPSETPETPPESAPKDTREPKSKG